MKENIDIAPIILFMGVLNKKRHPRSQQKKAEL